MSSAEQRKNKRSKTPFEGLIDASDSSMQSRIVNISVSGVLASTLVPVAEMTTVDMTIEVPTAQLKLLEVEGTVVRCYPDPDNPGEFLVAILFKNIDPSTYDTIRTYVDYDNPLDEL